MRCAVYAAVMGEGRRRFTIQAEVTVDVTDTEALRKAALGRVAEAQFVAHGDRSVDEIRNAETDDVQADLTAALDWVTDADAIVDAGIGAEVVGSSLSVVEGDADKTAPAETPDFVALFPVCRCEADDCDACSGFQMTPRTAAVLWAVAQLHADFAYDDIEQYGDAPIIDADGGWVAFADYPRITWGQDAVWRRQAARAFDDLAADLAAGRLPSPTCPGRRWPYT